MTTLDTRLKTLDADCENAAETESISFLKTQRNGGANLPAPFPSGRGGYLAQAYWGKGT